jgi:hypothetical protein
MAFMIVVNNAESDIVDWFGYDDCHHYAVAAYI